jgi:hypothetical protein
LEGYANDLFHVVEEDNYKCIRLVDVEGDADFSISFESVDPSGKHPLIEKFLSKKIEMSIKVIEE